MGWVVGIGVVLLVLVVVVLAVIAENPDTRREWAVRYHCPGCDVRYEAPHDNRFFLRFTVCPDCGTDKEEFSRDTCRFVDGEWHNLEDAEAVAKVLMAGE